MSDNEETTTPNDPFGYTKLKGPELREVIVELTKQRLTLEDDKKEWVSAANDAIKETKKRIELAVSALRDLEKTGTDRAHDKAATAFLASKGVTA